MLIVGNVIQILLYKKIKAEKIAPKRAGYWDTGLVEENEILIQETYPQSLLVNQKSSKKGTPKCRNKKREEFRAKSLQERKQEAIDLISGDSQDQENPGKIQCTSTKKCRHKKREEFMEKSLHEKKQESLDRSLNEDSEEELGEKVTKVRSKKISKRKEFLEKSLKERRQEGLDRSILDDSKKNEEHEKLGEVHNLDDKFGQVYKEILDLSVVESSILDKEEKDVVSQVDELLQEASCVLESVDKFITDSQMVNQQVQSDLEKKDIWGEDIEDNVENLPDDQKLALQLVDTVLVVLMKNVDKILEKDDEEPKGDQENIEDLLYLLDEEDEPEDVEETEAKEVEEVEPKNVEQDEAKDVEEVKPKDVEEVEPKDVEEDEPKDVEEDEPKDVEEAETKDVEEAETKDVEEVEPKDVEEDEPKKNTDGTSISVETKTKRTVSTSRKTARNPSLPAKKTSQRTALKNIRKDMKNPEANLQLKRLTKTSFIKKLGVMDGKETTRSFTNVYNLNLTEDNEQRLRTSEPKMRTFTNKKNLPITNDTSKERNFTNRKNLPLTVPKAQERTFTNRNNLSIHKKSKLVNKQDAEEISTKIDAKKATKTDTKVTSKTVTKVFAAKNAKVACKTAPKVASKTVTKEASKRVSTIGTDKIDTVNNLTKVEKLPSNQRKVSISRSFTIKKENSTKKTEVKLRPVAKGKERRVGTVTKPNWKPADEKKKSGVMLENSEKDIIIERMKNNMEKGGQVKSLKKEIDGDFNTSYDELDGIREYLNKTKQQNTPGTL